MWIWLRFWFKESSPFVISFWFFWCFTSFAENIIDVSKNSFYTIHHLKIQYLNTLFLRSIFFIDKLASLYITISARFVIQILSYFIKFYNALTTFEIPLERILAKPFFSYHCSITLQQGVAIMTSMNQHQGLIQHGIARSAFKLHFWRSFRPSIRQGWKMCALPCAHMYIMYAHSANQKKKNSSPLSCRARERYCCHTLINW